MGAWLSDEVSIIFSDWTLHHPSNKLLPAIIVVNEQIITLSHYELGTILI